LRGISCVPLQNGLLQFNRGKTQVIFNPIQAAKNSYANIARTEDLSGIIDNVIVLATPLQLSHFIDFVKIISSEEGEKLQTCYNGLAKLKKYLSDDCGLTYDIQDACSLYSAALVHRLDFGDQKQYDTDINA